MSDSHPPEPGSLAASGRSAKVIFGTVTVYAGAAILALAACEMVTGGLLPGMPRTWYVNHTIWVGLGFVGVAVGIILQAKVETPTLEWQPEQPGLRFRRVVLYSRDGCHLCDDALRILERDEYREYLPRVEIVDIAGDPDLESRHGLKIPVVEFDGQERFHGRISEVLLRRLIDGTPPVDESEPDQIS